MRQLGIEGVSRQRKKIFTTRPDPDAWRLHREASRRVVGHGPHLRAPHGQAWLMCVSSSTRSVAGSSGGGWRVASNMKTEMVLDALEMARLSRDARRLVGLVTHSDAGSQFTSVRFTERLDEIGARPPIGTVADSYDNALAETTNGLYKTELVYGPEGLP
jgi:putative transposase